MIEESRRGRLLSLKLAALVREHEGRFDSPAITPQTRSFALGAVALDGATGWVLLDERPERGLGPALAWALRAGADRLHLLAEHGTGTLARRATDFRLPIEVWHIADRVLLPAIAEPLPSQPELEPDHDALRSLIIEGGATPAVEHGVLTGEVRGLEVCRVVTDANTGQARLDVGIGQHDREAFRMLHGDVPDVEALADVVAAVEPHRRYGADPHPLNRLGREQAVRARLIDEPALIGATNVEPLQGPLPRPNLKDPYPSLATAIIDHRPVTLVVSAGVDLDVVPFAVDARLATGDPTRVVVPARDALPVQTDIAALLRDPIPVVPLD